MGLYRGVRRSTRDSRRPWGRPSFASGLRCKFCWCWLGFFGSWCSFVRSVWKGDHSRVCSVSVSVRLPAIEYSATSFSEVGVYVRVALLLTGSGKRSSRTTVIRQHGRRSCPSRESTRRHAAQAGGVSSSAAGEGPQGQNGSFVQTVQVFDARASLSDPRLAAAPEVPVSPCPILVGERKAPGPSQRGGRPHARTKPSPSLVVASSPGGLRRSARLCRFQLHTLRALLSTIT